MYIIVAIVMSFRGFSDVVMMRSQLALAFGPSQGYLPPGHYDQIFSAHGVIMIFFMAMPFLIGLINIAVPLQIGAAGCRLPLHELPELLAVPGRRYPDESFPGHR